MTWLEVNRMREAVGKNPLAAAFVLSLIIHALLYSTWKIGKAHRWWEGQPAWLTQFYKLLQPDPSSAKLTKLLPQIVPPEVRRKEIPLIFLDVPPTLAAAEPPKEAKYYGAVNAQAAQPDPSLDTKDPKMDGKQEVVPRIQDVPRPVPFPLQPAAPPSLDPAEAQQAKPKPAEAPGQLTQARPAEPRPSDGQADATIGTAPRERPRTLAAARAAKGMLAGEKMKQDGGVKRRGVLVPDVKATPFGAYDAAFIAAVQQRWYDLIDSSQVLPRSGKVVLQFRLTYDGRITDMKVTLDTVGELLSLLCQRAVLDPQPYARWPSDMRRMIGENYREVTFTFYYH